MIGKPISILGRPSPGFHFLDDVFVPYKDCKHNTYRYKEGKKYYIVEVSGEDFKTKSYREWAGNGIRKIFVSDECKRRFCRVICLGYNYWEGKLDSVRLEIEAEEDNTLPFNEQEMELLRKTHCKKDEPILHRWEILDIRRER